MVCQYFGSTAQLWYWFYLYFGFFSFTLFVHLGKRKLIVSKSVQVAFQQADFAGWNLWAAINERPLLPFRYRTMHMSNINVLSRIIYTKDMFGQSVGMVYYILCYLINSMLCTYYKFWKEISAEHKYWFTIYKSVWLYIIIILFSM